MEKRIKEKIKKLCLESFLYGKNDGLEKIFLLDINKKVTLSYLIGVKNTHNSTRNLFCNRLKLNNLSTTTNQRL
jgi:hypothetical protein